MDIQDDMMPYESVGEKLDDEEYEKRLTKIKNTISELVILIKV